MSTDFIRAREDFRDARRQAAIQQVLARLTGQPAELLQYDDIRRELKATSQQERGLQDVPLDAIVGSVGRSDDYTRTFLPRNDSDEERWARVKTFIETNGIIPIELYKLGDVYFVKDGNHRVSIARLNHLPTIPAYVTEVNTRVPISKDDQPQDIICKARYAEFLETTRLDQLRPEASLYTSICGQYEVLLSHIDVHRYFMGLDYQRDIAYDEAVTHWYDTVYLPLVAFCHQQGLPHEFPGRTDTDLYLIVAEHHASLEQNLGWKLDSGTVVAHLAQERSRPVGEKLADVLLPSALEEGPPTGVWRRQRIEPRPRGTIFTEILVAGRGIPADGDMLAHAIRVAQRENGRILGLRVLRDDSERSHPDVLALQAEFLRRTEAAGVRGEPATAVGPVARTISERAAWSDLVVLAMARSASPQTATGLGSDFATILQRSPRPVLAVPEGANSPLDRALLAVDGSSKSREALYAAAYLAGNWPVSLIVVAVGPQKRTNAIIADARSYLQDHGVTASFVQPNGPVADMILATAVAHTCNFLIMGSYGERPLLQILVGSTLTDILGRTTVPVLICR